jgi:hypothetical protein
MPTGAPKKEKFCFICAARPAWSSRAMPTSAYISCATAPRRFV